MMWEWKMKLHDIRRTSKNQKTKQWKRRKVQSVELLSRDSMSWNRHCFTFNVLQSIIKTYQKCGMCFYDECDRVGMKFDDYKMIHVSELRMVDTYVKNEKCEIRKQYEISCSKKVESFQGYSRFEQRAQINSHPIYYENFHFVSVHPFNGHFFPFNFPFPFLVNGLVRWWCSKL